MKIDRSKFLLLAVALAGSACSSGNSSSGGACVSQSGAVACGDVLDAFCARVVQCCYPNGATTCQCTGAAWCDVTQCKASQLTQGYDCSSPHYSKSVCQNLATTCTQDVPLMACSDIRAGTDNWPTSCVTFWSAFE